MTIADFQINLTILELSTDRVVLKKKKKEKK